MKNSNLLLSFNTHFVARMPKQIKKQITYKVICSFCILRKLGDSNPRYGCPYVSLANWWFQPLTQTSLPHHSQMQCKVTTLFGCSKRCALFFSGIRHIFSQRSAQVSLSPGLYRYPKQLCCESCIGEYLLGFFKQNPFILISR